MNEMNVNEVESENKKNKINAAAVRVRER